MTLWMLYAIVFGALAVAGGLALDRAARMLALPTRFVWLAMLVAAIAGPLVLPSMDREPLAANRVELAQRGTVSAGAVSSLPTPLSTFDRFIAATRTLDRPLVIGWIALTILCITRFVLSMLTLWRRRTEWVARTIAGTECFVTRDMGPAVVAVPDARILVPEWALGLDQGSLATVIRHERQHLGARDAYLIVTGSLAAALVPWNPAIWLIRRRLRLALEMDCDARVLAEEPRVERYGSLLLAIAQRPRLIAGLGATLTESTSDLERRIDAMTAHPPRHPRLRATLFAAASIGAIAIACGMPAPDVVAPRAADPLAEPLAPEGVMFDFQVHKPASANPSNLPPRYPDRLRAANIEGRVVGKFVVDTNGQAEMRTFEIVKSDHPDFTAAVREALPNMRFHPARVGGHAVRQLVQMPFSFSLVKGEQPAGERKPKIDYQVAAPGRPQVLFEIGAGDSVPGFVSSNAPPIYPTPLRAANVQGMVQAKFVVRPDGTADMSTFVVRRSDHEAFTTAVRAAVAQWRFRPATKDGKPVAALIQMPFMFSLSR